MSEFVTAYVALGSNLGDRSGHLAGAFAALAGLPETVVVAISAIYETAPLGPAGQQDYLNAVVRLRTALGPYDLLAALLAIEQTRGRIRRERWGARTLDLDLLLHGETTLADPRLTLPHPELLNRAFVLVPLNDLDPGLLLAGRTVAQHLASLDCSGVRPFAAGTGTQGTQSTPPANAR